MRLDGNSLVKLAEQKIRMYGEEEEGEGSLSYTHRKQEVCGEEMDLTGSKETVKTKKSINQ